MKKNYFYFLTFFVLVRLPLSAQNPKATRDYVGNHMFWFNGAINGKIKGKFNYQLDVEYRRQADPNHPYNPGEKVGSNHYNIFKNPYQDALRPWIHYQPNEKIRFSWSPITWFGSWSFPTNGKVTFQPEFRTSPQITLYNTYGRVQVQQRYRYEFRFYGLKVNDPNKADPTGPSSSYKFLDSNSHNRFRYMLRVVIPLNKHKIEKGTYYLMTSSELFLKTGKYVQNRNIFDQNRFHLVLGYKFHPEMRFEVGYMNQMAFRLNNKAKNNVDVNNCLFVSFVIENLNNLFKKKDKAG